MPIVSPSQQQHTLKNLHSAPPATSKLISCSTKLNDNISSVNKSNQPVAEPKSDSTGFGRSKTNPLILNLSTINDKPVASGLNKPKMPNSSRDSPCLLALPLKKLSMVSNNNNNNKMSTGKASLSQIKSDSITSLEPLSRSFSNTSSLKSVGKTNRLNGTKNAGKKKVSSPLSVIDYCNIINMNTSHQMLVNFIQAEASADAMQEHKPPMHMFLNNYIQKQATLSEQMALLFGSSMCTCYLCRMKTIDSKRILQHNYEIIPSSQGYSIRKYTYSNPISELSSLKLFNLMNTDCSIFFKETNKDTAHTHISNNSVLLPFGSTDTLPVNNSMKVNNNSPPIYDSRYMYLIDCRSSRKEFDRMRIHTAIHVSDLLNDTVYLSPPFENYTVVVLYDEEGGLLRHCVGDDENLPKSHYLVDSIRAKLNCSVSKTIYILSGGYKGFYSKFRFMCSHLNIRSTVDRNKYLTIYPNCVIESQIYIGSAIQAKNWKIIRDLRITHIINATYEHECVFKDEIKYLHVEIEDSHSEKINKTFKVALDFICEAFDAYSQCLKEEMKTSDEKATELRPPVFLIHCNLGISRSSSILIAYLIAKYRLCLCAAFKYVKDKRLQIAPNYSFLRQLKQFEENI